ncbi:hypothetical protein JCM8097_000077 [Rhodosporidiobolus ruineniae]
MSIDLEWSALDAHLTLTTTRFLSSAFESAPRPNFLGPLEVTHFSFGDQQPDITLADIRDIYPHFLQPQPDDDDDLLLPSAPPPPPPLPPGPPHPPGDSFDSRSLSGATPLPFPFPAHPSQQPPSAALFSPGLLHHSFSPASPLPFGPNAPTSRSRSRSHSPAPPGLFQPGLGGLGGGGGFDGHSSGPSHTHPHSYAPPSPTPSHSSLPGGLRAPLPSSAPSPSFQTHLHLSYSGNLSLGISTSLLINYPSPGFMSLPLQLTLTGLAFEGTLVVAFEGGTRRIHLSLLDPGPDGSSTAEGSSSEPYVARPAAAGSGRLGAAKETPGMRLLRSAVVESEVGQADKHVLKNVGKVEKFVLEVARRTLENELVFPNFQTILF